MTIALDIETAWRTTRDHTERTVVPDPPTELWSRWFAERTSMRSWTSETIADASLLDLIAYGRRVSSELLPSAPPLRAAVLRRSGQNDELFSVEADALRKIGSRPTSPLMIQKDLDLAPTAIVLGFDLSQPDVDFMTYRRALQCAGAMGGAIWAKANDRGLAVCASPGLVRSKLPELGLAELTFSSLWAIVLGYPHPDLLENKKEVK